jgi:hypothetical protein
MSCRLPSALAVVICLLVAPAALAQTDSPQAPGTPAHIAVVQGSAVLERDGAGETAVENLPLLEGDRLRTESGRIEVILPDGSVLDLDRDTTVDLLAGGLMRLMGGRLIFILAAGPGGDVRRDYQVDTPAGIVRFTNAGEYRVSVQASAGVPFLDVSVVRGRAVVDAEGRSMPLSAGERAQASQGQGVTALGSFNSAMADVFVEWAELQRGQRVGTRSNAYLPSDLRIYGGTFDRDGSWDRSSENGWVWYPRVEADWQPYYSGSWYPYGWGWTWVAPGPWVWPTHHYGRWGRGARGWYWIPSAVWGPAWVSWGYSTDLVGWCPLGWDDGPAFGYSVGSGRSWRGWTVVPQHAFGSGRGYRVQPYALQGDRLRAAEQPRFDVRRTGPSVPGAGDRRGSGGGRANPNGRTTATAFPRTETSPGSSQGQPSTAPRDGAAQRPAAAISGLPAGRPGLGSAVPRSAPARPSDSRSPYYYLGPSRPPQASPASPSPELSARPSSNAGPAQAAPPAPTRDSAGQGWGIDSSPSPSPYPSPYRQDTATPRSRSASDRASSSRPPASAPSAGSASGRVVGGSGAPTAGSSSGIRSTAPSSGASPGLGGRTPGRSPSGAAAPGGGGRGGGRSGGGGGRGASRGAV